MFVFTRKGLKFHKPYTDELAVRKIGLPERLYLPLMSGGAELYAIKKRGDRIFKYEPVAENGRHRVFSPCAGAIDGFETRSAGGRSAECVVIIPDAVQPPDRAFSSLTFPGAEELLETAEKFSLTDFFFGKAVRDTLEDLFKNGKRLVVNAADGGPGCASNSAAVINYFQEILSAARWIVGGGAGGYVIMTNNIYVSSWLKNSGDKLPLVSLPGRYPESFWTNRYAEKNDVAVISATALYSLFRAVAHGAPQVDSIISVVGRNGRNIKIYEAAVGTPVGALIKDYSGGDAEITVINGAMRGFMSDAKTPVAADTHALCPPPAKARRTVACIGCGLCNKTCPAGIKPLFIYESVIAGNYRQAGESRAEQCIGCNCCSYVCPSAIPLAQTVAAAKSRIGGCENE